MADSHDPPPPASDPLGSEPLDVRLAREIPDLDTGEYLLDRQIVGTEEDGDPADEEEELAAEVDDGYATTLSPEEAAMRVVDEPPGMNYDPDPGYLSDSGGAP